MGGGNETRGGETKCKLREKSHRDENDDAHTRNQADITAHLSPHNAKSHRLRDIKHHTTHMHGHGATRAGTALQTDLIGCPIGCVISATIAVRALTLAASHHRMHSCSCSSTGQNPVCTTDAETPSRSVAMQSSNERIELRCRLPRFALLLPSVLLLRRRHQAVVLSDFLGGIFVAKPSKELCVARAGES